MRATLVHIARRRFFDLSVALLTSGAFWAGASEAALQVSSTLPTRYDLAVPVNLSEIQIFCNGPLAPLPAEAVRVAGTMSGLHSGQIIRMDNLIRFVNQSEPFFPGEMVIVNLSRDIQNLGGEPLIGGYFFAFTIASGPGSLAWSERDGYGAASIPYFIHGGDLDEDDRPDVAAPNEGTDDVSIFLSHPGVDRYPVHQEYPVGMKPSSIFGEDLDNDGDQDLSTADIDGGSVSVLLNNGDGTFAPAVSYTAGSLCRQVHGGDFDGDNDVDLCATAYGEGDVHIYLNAGDGSFTEGTPITAVSIGPFAIRTADVNLDGHLDIGVACRDADSLTILTNNGTGGFSRTGTYLMGDGPWCLNGNDMDGDGDFDFVSVASNANQMVVLFNNGAGGFPTRHFLPAGSFPLGVFAADLDGDGDVDATASSFNSGTVKVYTNPGNGLIALQATLFTAGAGTYAWAHDLDGDSDLDLSVADEAADSLYVFYNGSVVAGAPSTSGRSSFERISVFPNPIDPRDGAVVRFAVLQGSEVRVDLIGVDGRLVRRIWGGIASEGEMSIPWRFAPEAESPPPAGRYLLKMSGSGIQEARPIAILPAR